MSGPSNGHLALLPPLESADALDDYYETRAAAVLAYCSRLCAPSQIGAAVEASFAELRNAVSDGRPSDAELDAQLRLTTRAAAAERSGASLPLRAPDVPAARRLYQRFVDGDDASACLLMPRLLAARADGELSGSDGERLERHLRVCAGCRAADRRFDAAERALEALLPQWALAPQSAAAVATTPEATPEPSPQREVAPVRERPRLRRRLSIVLAIVGVLLVTEAALTVFWKEPFTSYLASRSQDALRSQLALIERTPQADAAQVARTAGVDSRIAVLARDLNSRTAPGRALGTLTVPRVGIDFVFVQGEDAASLRTGPGHYTETVLPGEPGTVGIAGHRTTYLAPFRNIDALRSGDRIVVTMPYGRFQYAVASRQIVPAGWSNAFRDVGHQQLVLSACHPLYSSSHRILITARLVSRQPLGAAAGPPAPPLTGESAAALSARQLAALGRETLTIGSTGAAVRELQYLLGIPASGYFGYDTQNAVEALEGSDGMARDGIVGPRLKRLLAARPGAPLRPPTPPPVAPASPAAPRR